MRAQGKVLDIDAVIAARMKRPQHQHEIGCRRLEQSGKIDIEGAEADAVFAKLAARVLIERLDVGGGRFAADDAEILRQLVGKPAREPRHVGRLAELDERLELAAKLSLEPGFEAERDALAIGA